MITKTLAKNIRELRVAKGLTQEQLAGRCEVSEQTIQLYESEKRWISSSMVTAIAKALKVDEEALFAANIQIVQVERVIEVDKFRDLVLTLAPLKHTQVRRYLDLIAAETAGARGKPLPEPGHAAPEPGKTTRRAR